jgi:phosphoenolpyruvate carboxylase
MASDSTTTAPPAADASVRAEDLALHEDVRWLAAALGRAIKRLEGDDAFETVESLRQACRARRHGDANAPSLDDLLDKVAALPTERAAITARAFTLFFLLINTAEQVHRVRRTRAYRAASNDEPQPASARWTMRALRAAGRDANGVARAIATLDVRPVLTAHPTESTRRTLLGLQARVADLLLARDGAPAPERRTIESALDAEVELLWVTDEVRHDRPSVKDEVSTVLWYLETRLIDAGARARDALVRAFEEEFGVASAEVENAVPLTLGNWVGGDRDGNPFVTPDVTIAAARRASYAILARYATRITDLIERLSVSTSFVAPDEHLLSSIEADAALEPVVYEANRQRNADEPLRLKLSLMAARIEATRRLVAARDAGRATEEPSAYPDSSAFAADLELVRRTLAAGDLKNSMRELLDPLVIAVRAYGFFGYMMDVRDHADVHRSAVDDIARRLGISLDGDALRAELAGRRPLVNAHLPLDEATRRSLDTFAAIRTIQAELGERAASTYIISMTTGPDDLLRVLLLAREAGLVDLAADAPQSSIDVVPLFETLDDLERAPAIMRALLADPIYQRQLAARGNRQEVMIGYSDSGKDAGILASSWALYEGQEKLAAVFDDAGVQLRLFHGRGGSVGRGGGSPVARALAALPPGTTDGRIKITEQGEIISQQFGLASLAERTLEVTLAGTLAQELDEWQSTLATGELDDFRRAIRDLSAKSLAVYRDLVHDHTELFELFRVATPIAELADARFGSRPAYRPGGGAGIAGIRAIPWGFGWTQIRLMLTGWLGAGTALADFTATPDGLALLRRMAERWPFFDDLLAKIEMVCAKSDPAIARAYVERLGADTKLLARLEDELARTVDALLLIRDSTALLRDNQVLRSAIALRNPYVDALSLLQIALLERKRASSLDETDRDAVNAALATTLSGIAQGLRNTG